MHFQAAIDEFGTAIQQSKVWTIVSLDDHKAGAFIAKAPALLGGGLKMFQGKDFTRKSEDRFGIDGIDHAASVEIDREDLLLKQAGAYTFAVA